MFFSFCCRRILRGLGAATGGLLLATSVMATELVLPAPSDATLKTINPSALRERPVRLAPQALAALATAVGADAPQALKQAQTTASTTDSVTVEFFPGARFELTPRSGHADRERLLVQGEIAGQPLAWFTLATVEESVALDVALPDGRTYQLRGAADGLHTAREIQTGDLPPCGVNAQNATKWAGRAAAPDDPRPHAAEGAAKSRNKSTDADGRVDVLVLYTTQARIDNGGTAGMLALIDLAVANANTAYQNSGVDQNLALVYAGETTYVASASDMEDDLNRLSNSSDGVMDEAYTLRDLYRADFVNLMVSNATASSCGIGWQYTGGTFNSTFSVTAADCVSNQTFAHELGHNMGCGHAYLDDGATPGSALHGYSRGHRWTGLSSNAYRSVMAYAPGYRVRYFSNPDVLYDGVATGVAIGSPGEANNAATLVEAREVSANHRISNDNFEDRIALPVGYRQIGGTTINRTREAGEPQHAGQSGSHSSWWAWTAQSTGVTTLTTQGSSFDTLLGVYTGSTVGSLSAIASNDDAVVGETYSTVVFNATAGTTYQLAVDAKSGDGGKVLLSFDLGGAPTLASDPTSVTAQAVVGGALAPGALQLRNAGGGSTAFSVSDDASWLSIAPSTGTLGVAPLTLAVNYDLAGLTEGVYTATILLAAPGATNSPLGIPVTLTVVPSAVNDLFANAIACSGMAGSVAGSNQNSSAEIGEPLHAGVSNEHSVWWRWTPEYTSTVTIDTLGSDFDTVMGVYTGSAVDALTEIIFNDDIDYSAQVYQSGVSFTAIGGTPYFIAVDGYKGKSGIIQLNWLQAPNAAETWELYP